MLLLRLVALASLAAFASPLLPQQQESANSVTFSTTTNLVVVDVDVRDSSGSPIEDLTAEDFELVEDREKQQISIFEYQRIELDAPPLEPSPDADPEAVVALRKSDITPSAPGSIRFKNRRLMVLFFDFSSMPPPDQIRAQKSAEEFLTKHMTAQDLVAIMAYTNRLTVLQDFTADRDLLSATVRAFRIGDSSELAGEAETGEETSIDAGEAFTADETEFNIFNTDQKLSALESAAKMLSSLPEKKALVYFSSGVGQTGMENRSQLRATVNAAVRGNVSFYPIDVRGLVAEAPAGNADQGSERGSRTFSGAAQRGRRARFNNQQDTLFTLAADTGGQVFLDSNNLTLGITRAQKDISSYYILGYYSTNPKMDGRYRRIQVRVRGRKRAKLDYRSGYFGPKEFRRFSSADKERQLEEALLLGDPVTDLTLALELNYFRFDGDRYFVPIAVKIPGSEVELARKSGSEETRFDFLAQVRNRRGRLIGSLRDNIKVKLKGEDASRLSSRQLQYDAGFTLLPGSYVLKFLARENQTGKMGTFETRFEVPDLDQEKRYARISSVVWSNQREPLSAAVGQAAKDKKLLAKHPLIHDGVKLIPSITRVFRQDQNLFVYFELYDPGTNPQRTAVGVSARVSFFRGGVKAFESEPVRVTEASSTRSKTVPFEFQIPLKSLAPGEYICQISVVDELGRKFAFRRAPLVLLPANNRPTLPIEPSEPSTGGL